jgi:hypothetical protein
LFSCSFIDGICWISRCHVSALALSCLCSFRSDCINCFRMFWDWENRGPDIVKEMHVIGKLMSIVFDENLFLSMWTFAKQCVFATQLFFNLAPSSPMT